MDAADSKKNNRRNNKRAASTPAEELSDAEFNARRAAGNKKARAAEAEAAANAAGKGASVEGRSAEENRTAFVVNLDFHTKDAGLKDMFTSCGGETGWV